MKKVHPRAMSRRMHSRLAKLSNILRNQPVHRLEDLKEELDATRKTLQADIDHLRSIGHPIEHDRKKGWFYNGPPPELELSVDELFAILVAEKTLSSYRGTPFELPLKDVFRRFSGQEAPVYKCSWDHLSSAVTIKQDAITTSDLNIYKRVVTGVAMQKELQIHYKGMQDTFPQARKVRPYHLCCSRSSWYLIAFDIRSSKVKTFALPRISKAEVLQRSFLKPKNESIKKDIDQAFGVFFDSKPEKLKIAFTGVHAKWVEERGWHSTQSLERIDDCVILTMETGITPEVEQWILSFGEHAKVLEPVHLAALISSRLRTAAQRYPSSSVKRTAS